MGKTDKDKIFFIKVEGLFESLDQEFELSESSKVTILHGPNGVGKTVVLKMIYEVMNFKFKVLERIPFSFFRIEFQSGDYIELLSKFDRQETQSKTSSQADRKLNKVTFKCQVKKKSYSGDYGQFIDEDVDALLKLLGSSWRQISDDQFIDESDGEIINFELACNRVGLPYSNNHLRRIKNKEKGANDPKIGLELISNKCRVRMIGTDRLTNPSPNFSRQPKVSRSQWQHSHNMTRSNPEVLEAVTVYSNNLRDQLRSLQREYFAMDQKLDRSVVNRLVEKEFQQFDEHELISMSTEIEAKRQELASLGILLSSDDVFGQYPQASDQKDLLKVIKRNLEFFSIYLEDKGQKLAIFDDLKQKLKILEGRTNKRFRMKKLTVSSEEGIEFTTTAGVKIKPEDLSSGEQHQLILLYELFLASKNGDLILVDEPEISLHLEWQIVLHEDLELAFNSSDVSFILATHSPAIIQSAPLDAIVWLGE